MPNLVYSTLGWGRHLLNAPSNATSGRIRQFLPVRDRGIWNREGAR